MYESSDSIIIVFEFIFDSIFINKIEEDTPPSNIWTAVNLYLESEGYNSFISGYLIEISLGWPSEGKLK